METTSQATPESADADADAVVIDIAVAVAVVIGSTSGIGRALVQKLLAAQWSVVGVSRSAATIVDDRYEHICCDVTSPEYRAILAKLPACDLVVYCAGIGDALDLEGLGNGAETRVFAVNLMGLVTTVEALLPGMLGRGHGHFIGISSQADHMINPGAPSYSASKAAVSSYLEGLGLAVRKCGVRVTNVRPGFVDTKMAKGPVRPFMLSAEEAADRILATLKPKPLRVTFPWSMGALIWLVRWPTRIRVWWG